MNAELEALEKLEARVRAEEQAKFDLLAQGSVRLARERDALREALSEAYRAIRDGGDILHADRIRNVESILHEALGEALAREDAAALEAERRG